MKGLVIWLVGSLALGLVVSMSWWWMIEPSSADDNLTLLEIPSGTAAAVAAGNVAPFIPQKLVLGRNRELRVINSDVADHNVGGFTVPAGSSATIKPSTQDDRLSCTIHPGGSLGVGIDGRPNPLVMAVPTLLIGLPLGFVCWIVAAVSKKLDTGSGVDGQVGA